MIFFHIEDAPTAFRFGVANTRLMMIGERRIKQLLGDRNWEGDRLIIVYDSDDDDDDDDEGDDGDGNNDGVIKDEDSGNKDKDDGNKDKDDGDDDNEDGGDDGDEEDEDDGVEEDEDDGIDLPEGLDLGDLKHFTERADWRWSSILSRGLPSHTPEYRIAEDLATPLYVEILKPEVMWNLTKHVYVRSDAIPTNQELPDRWADWFDTGDEKEDMDNKMGWILLVHIIWTNYSLFNHKPDAFGGVFYGKWAGDRFEVTAKDVLETRLKETGCGWTDYSEEAVQLFIDVFNST